MITKLEHLDISKHYTYADYLTWQFDEMVELIRGKVIKMSPAPGVLHQKISGNLHGTIWQHLKNRQCQIFVAPFDVRLPLPMERQTADKIDTVVQPDLSIICDPAKLDAQGCNGAPDWVIEILSPATSKKDLTDKYDIYQNAGVKEYWVVYPDAKAISCYVLNEEGVYLPLRSNPYVIGEHIVSHTLPDLTISVEEVWA